LGLITIYAPVLASLFHSLGQRCIKHKWRDPGQRDKVIYIGAWTLSSCHQNCETSVFFANKLSLWKGIWPYKVSS